MIAAERLFDRDFDAVIFDLDGTLIDSHEAMVRSYGTWAEEYGVDLAELPQYLGMPNSVMANDLFPSEKAARAVARLEELEVSDAGGVVALPGAIPALTLLGPLAAIATSCTMALFETRSRAAGLPVPEVIVTRDQVTNGKPSPDSFLLAAERLGVDPARALVVEDARAGVAAGRAAGCSVLGVLSTLDAETLGADVSVNDLAEVSWDISGGRIRLSRP